VTFHLSQEIIMLTNIDIKKKHRRSVRLTAVAILAGGTFIGSASADERRDEHRDYHHRDWNGGYYRGPPVVYGTPYYAPPIVYGPGFGLNINIR
jgi:hypothetical protein